MSERPALGRPLRLRPPLPERAPLADRLRAAGEIAVNVVLPFLHALGQASGDTRLSERDLALYRPYPPTAPNRVTREMARQLGGDRGVA